MEKGNKRYISFVSLLFDTGALTFPCDVYRKRMGVETPAHPFFENLKVLMCWGFLSRDLQF